ncbi:hypothetical protein [Paenibacillus sp. HB172176]|uniref:hypothetical protein n=1 Tax=Paenibacillus sp. HB172176 TaxID=2493690 RepID=UPI00143A018C|nr:hypothetical protein [Paenibacillus sp. HB172176]
MKKTKLPGENISLKTKKGEDPLVMEWLNAQSNLMDSIRYLVEKEIAASGVRNLQTCIPAERGELSAGGESDVEASKAANLEFSTGLGQSAAAAETAAEPEEEVDEEDIEAWS